MKKGFIERLNEIIAYGFKPGRATVAVRADTARRALGLKKGDPLVYRGIYLRPIGSAAWRRKNEGAEA